MDLLWKVTYLTDQGEDSVEILAKTAHSAEMHVALNYKPSAILEVEEA